MRCSMFRAPSPLVTIVLTIVATTQAIPKRAAAPNSLGIKPVIWSSRVFRGADTACKLSAFNAAITTNSMIIQKTRLAIQLSIGKDSPPLCPVTAAASLLSISVLLRIFLTIPLMMAAIIQPTIKIKIALIAPTTESPRFVPRLLSRKLSRIQTVLTGEDLVTKYY